MLPSAHRMKRRAEFSSTVRRGRRAGAATVVVHLGAAERAADAPRVGFIVSKAVGDAVARNTVKRRFRHLLRERISLLPNGSTVVVRALPMAAGASFDELGRDLDQALSRLLGARTARAEARA